MAETIRVGVVGTGKMGILHGGILHSLDQVKPCAIVEREKQLHTFIRAVLPNVTVYADSEEMFIKETLDLVYIVTPTPSHVEIAEACVDTGINFFVEKPLGITAGQCLPLVEKIKKHPVINMVGYCNHFVDTFMKAKEIIDSNVLGNLIHLRSHIYLSQVLVKSKKGKGADNVRG
ncbi:Gfo/Idh/MocA family protein, partial [Chloroflexota bacterium]